MQTSLQATSAKSFAMKSIGDQAQEFRERMGWTTKQLAFACGTSRQNIETLEKVGSRTPKYVQTLAKVMGTTVDTLMQGKYVFDPEHKPDVQVPANGRGHARPAGPSEGDLAAAVAILSSAIQSADELTRIQLEPLASLWARKPDVDGLIAQRIVKLLSESRPSQVSTETRSPSKPAGQDFEIDGDAGAGNGSSDSAGDEEERGPGSGRAAGGDAG